MKKEEKLASLINVGSILRNFYSFPHVEAFTERLAFFFLSNSLHFVVPYMFQNIFILFYDTSHKTLIFFDIFSGKGFKLAVYFIISGDQNIDLKNTESFPSLAFRI